MIDTKTPTHSFFEPCRFQCESHSFLTIPRFCDSPVLSETELKPARSSRGSGSGGGGGGSGGGGGKRARRDANTGSGAEGGREGKLRNGKGRRNAKTPPSSPARSEVGFCFCF